jgi:hypothetical protein
MRILKPVALAITLCIASTSASAIPLNFSFYGTIDSAVTGNAFGLDVGDTVTVSGMFDDDPLTGMGVEVISFGEGTGNMLQIAAGLITFNETDTAGSGKPASFLVGGEFPILVTVLIQFDMLISDSGIAGGGFDASYLDGSDQFAGDFGIGPQGEPGIVGTWNLDSFTTTVKSLPEPGTLWMLLLGFGLVTFIRRNWRT